jgi:hypothetical protein
LGLIGLLAVLALAGCGSTPATIRFPAGSGRSLDQLRAGHPETLVLAPSGFTLAVGPNRFAFALFDTSHKLIDASRVALYTADASGGSVQGPFFAQRESLAVSPQFQSRTVAQDPSAARAVYVAQVRPPQPGRILITGLAEVQGHEVATTVDQFKIPPGGPQPPDVGQRAIVIHTPVAAQVHGNLASIDTRVPPAPDLQQVDFAQALGHTPVVLMFATPGLCQSRVCGPVVDIEEQVKSQIGPRVTFIHQEIYQNNTPPGLRPQVKAWHLFTEPWTFVIDRTGRISSRFEGALSAAELKQAVQKVLA